MPWIKDPDREAARVAAVRQAVALRRPWLVSTGPRTISGKRSAAQNSRRHGAGSMAFRAAMAYCREVEAAANGIALATAIAIAIDN